MTCTHPRRSKGPFIRHKWIFMYFLQFIWIFIHGILEAVIINYGTVYYVSITGYISETFWKGQLDWNPMSRQSDLCSVHEWDRWHRGMGERPSWRVERVMLVKSITNYQKPTLPHKWFICDFLVIRDTGSRKKPYKTTGRWTIRPFSAFRTPPMATKMWVA